MKPLPVSLSILASFLSAPFLMGTPAEIHCYGTMYSYILIGYIFSCIITAEFFVPVFHKLELTSAYEVCVGNVKVVRQLSFVQTVLSLHNGRPNTLILPKYIFQQWENVVIHLKDMDNKNTIAQPSNSKSTPALCTKNYFY